jgi:predicted RNA methylase
MGTVALQRIENRRYEEQARLDLLKTALQRNKLGQFATPPDLALSIARYAQTLLGDGPVSFLDPAIGTGSFFSALSYVFPTKRIQRATGFEVDALFASTARQLWKARGLDVIDGDFTLQPPREAYNLIIANPPYVRHHHMPGKDKERLKYRIAHSLDIDISGLAGLYCYFLLLCHEWMEDNGLAIWLIPSEFMDVNYGAAVRRYLTDRVTLLHIHRFSPTDVQFSDALVSSSVVVFRKARPTAGHRARFSLAGTINAPESEGFVSLDTLRQSHKWTKFPATTSISDRPELTLGEIFAIKRGLATGSNKFFILNEEQVRKWEIPHQVLRPILPGPRYLASDIVDALPDGSPGLSPHLFLLDSSEPEYVIQHRWPGLYAYLQTGQEQEIPTSYLASRRTPWYSQEQRPPAPFLCTYMGRARNGEHPFRFIWNRSTATAHNVYLMLYPRGPLLHALGRSPEMYLEVLRALQAIAPEQLVSEGRVYGGGLHKVEPRELAEISADPVLSRIGHTLRIERQERLFL